MKTALAALALATLAFAASAPADAKGCIKGAVVGGVAGHFAGHHGALGAAAGCLYGRHRANEQDKQQQQGAGARAADRDGLTVGDHLDGTEHGEVRRGPSGLACPTHVLFNGGVLNAPLVRERIVATLNSWLDQEGMQPVKLLSGEDLMHAVSRGAAYYGLARTGRGVASGLAALAWPAMEANDAGSFTAISASIFRSSVTPAALRPDMSWAYVSPCSRAAALMRTIHSVRKSRFLRRRPTNAYLSAVSTDSFAARYSLLLFA